MSDLQLWAQRWGVPQEALNELGINLTPAPSPPDLTSEAGVSKHVRLQFAGIGAMLWRNNVGVLQDERGVPVRYGLCNESSQMNKRVKSSDLIGIRPVVITQEMVGHTIGQFVAREAKRPGWKYLGTPREKAQLKFLEIVISKGGDGAFTVGDL